MINPQDISAREKSTGHAVFSPSQLYRIMACPASAVEATRAPITPPSSYALHGTMLHGVVADILDAAFSLEGSKQFHKLERGDQNYVLDCIDYAWTLRESGDPETMEIEEPIDLKTWGLPEIWGTSDFNIKSLTRTTIDVVDWKFGSGVQVYAQDNEQLMAYAAGAVGYPNYFHEIIIHVVQPPLNHYDKWVIEGSKLQEWVFDVLAPAIQTVHEMKEPIYHPGEKQCRFCPAGMTCRARYKQNLKNAQEVFRVYSAMPNVTPKELSDALEKAAEVNQYAKQIAKFAERELMLGRPFPGWKLVAGRAIRKWVNEEDATSWLLGNSMLSEDDLYKKTPISPAQAEKLDRSLKKNPQFSALIDKPDGKPQLVKEDDKRPALQPDLEAAKAFADFEGDEDA